MIQEDIMTNIQESKGFDSAGYDELVSRCATSKSDIWIKNKSISHAAILFKYILKSAQKDVYLISGKMDSAFYANKSTVVEAIKEFLSSSEHKLSIIVTTCVDRLAIDGLKTALSESESARLNICELNLSEEDAKEVSHFMVSDVGALRYETDHTDDGDVTALASFGRADVAKTFVDLAVEALSSFSKNTKPLAAY